MTYIGIDLHTTNMVIVAINSNAEVVQEEKLPTSPARLEECFSHFDEPIHRIEPEIERQVPFEEAAERLMAVPGLGKVGAWTILADIGDITRFPSAKQFVSYCPVGAGG